MDEHIDLFAEAVELVEAVSEKVRQLGLDLKMEEVGPFGLVFERSLHLMQANLRTIDPDEVKDMLEGIYRQQHRTLRFLTRAMSQQEKVRAAMLVNTCGLVLLFRVLMANPDEMVGMIFAAIDDANIADGLLDPQSKFNTGIAP